MIIYLHPENSKLIVLRTFFDGSRGDNGEGSEWLTLAGYVSNDALWAEFDRAWTTMLRNHYPIAPYVHMTDLMTANDPFERKPDGPTTELSN